MHNKFEQQKPFALLDTSKYPPEVAGRFNSFITTQFDDSLSVEMQMRSIIKWAIDNFKEMDQTYNEFTEYIIQGNLNPFIQFLNDLIEYMNYFIETFDEKYQETILDKMQEWYDNGELETLINESLDTKYHEMDEKFTSQLAQIAVDVKNFGAIGDGISDDTEAIYDAINYDTKGRHKVVKIPSGDYIVRPYPRIPVPSNTTIEFAPGARFVSVNTNNDVYALLHLDKVENITILNPTLVGDRNENMKTTEGAGHGISAMNVKNLIIKGGHISNCFTDGIYLMGVENALVENVVCDNNRRMGITLTSGRHVIIRDCTCSNSNGTAPMAGLDIEPNFVTDVIENVVIENLTTINNQETGLTIGLQHLNGSERNVSITVINHKDYGSTIGETVVNLQNVSAAITGSIKFIDSELYDNKNTGILVQDYDSVNTPIVEFIRPRLFNWNANANATGTWGSAIKFLRQYVRGTQKMGNVKIDEPYFNEDRTTPLSKGFYRFDDSSGIGFNKVIISNGNADTLPQITGVTSFDRENYAKRVITNDLDSFGGYSLIVNELQPVVATVNLRSAIQPAELETTYLNLGKQLRIVPTGCLILGMTTTTGNYIDTLEKGASITLKKVSESEYLITNKVGNWTVQP